jgi:hypothetical protein
VLALVGDLVGDLVGLGGGACVIALEEEKSATSACIQRKQIRIEHTLMERQHSGESRKGAPRRGTAARTAGNEENYCVIALKEESQRPVRAFKANTNRTHLMERHIG